jgi:uncharacterized protein
MSEQVGMLSSLHRYPVKSMMGESLNATDVSTAGVSYDRAYALSDPSTGKVVSAKNPSKWPDLFAFRAALAEPANCGDSQAIVRITLPNGRMISSDDPRIGAVLSDALGKSVTLLSASPPGAQLEEYWPDMQELPKRDVVTEEPLPPGTFFDCATVHLLTTSTLAALQSLHPTGRIEPRRFRPNFIVSTQASGFVENAWIGKTLSIGDQVQLKITGPCPRCVMTTLAQDDLPRDPMVLRTAAQHNGAHVGVYASVIRGGTIRRGDSVTLT